MIKHLASDISNLGVKKKVLYQTFRNGGDGYWANVPPKYTLHLQTGSLILLEEQRVYQLIKIRRAQGLDDDSSIIKGDISLNIETNELKIKGKTVAIGKTETSLLHYLMRTAGRAQTRATLLDQVWGQGVFIEERTVDVHILRLRKILKDYGVENRVETVRGIGYRFTDK